MSVRKGGIPAILLSKNIRVDTEKIPDHSYQVIAGKAFLPNDIPAEFSRVQMVYRFPLPVAAPHGEYRYTR